MKLTFLAPEKWMKMDENDTTMQLKSIPSPPKKTNVAPENGWLEYSFPFGARPYFQGRKPLVVGSESQSILATIR